MTQDEIIEMARQAGFPFNKYGLLQGDDEGEIDADEMFKAFAKLVAEKEREACAMLCLWHNNTLTQNPTLFHMAELIRTRNNQ